MTQPQFLPSLLAQASDLSPLRAWDERVPALPWADPDLSRRMLREHLSQVHDQASRRTPLVAAQVAWLVERLAPGARVLDAACGPGLHALALVARGYPVLGVDVGPAVIAYAESEASARGLAAHFKKDDIRMIALPDRFDAILLLYGFLHTLPPYEAMALLRRLRAHLAPAGRLFLELRSPDNWDRRTYHTWWEDEEGLFAPALILFEHGWDATAAAEIERYHIARTDGSLAAYDVTERRLDEEEWQRYLSEAGLILRTLHTDWPSEQPDGWLLLEVVAG